MTYHRGTLAEFTPWHNAAMAAEGIPNGEGTYAYSDAVKNPNHTDDYVWLYGRYPINGRADLSFADVLALNWFSEN